MEFLTNWIFWVILAAIIFIMALIGYLSEGTEFAKKALEKLPDNKSKKEKNEETSDAEDNSANINEVTLNEAANLNNENVLNNENNASLNKEPEIEILNVDEPNVWNGTESTPLKEEEVMVYNNAADDWTVMPQVSNENLDAPLETPKEVTPQDKAIAEINKNISEPLVSDSTSVNADEDIWKF